MQKHIFELFCAQLIKDFQGAGLNDYQPELFICDPLKVRGKIFEALNIVAAADPQNISRLLYRVDISEKQLNKFSKSQPALSFPEVVTELVIRRVLQKVILRKKYSNE